MSRPTLRIGVDASMLSEQRTGIGNYVFHLLRQLQLGPGGADFSFHLYSHRTIASDCRFLGTCTEGVGSWLRKGPLWLSTALPPLLDRDQIDVFWGANGYLPLRAGRSWQTVVTIYDLVYLHARHTMPWHSRWARQLLQPLGARRARCVTTISHATADDIRQHYGREVDAIIPPGMDPVFHPVSPGAKSAVIQKYQLPAQFWLTLGTLEPRKNLLTLLQAYEQVQQAHPATCPPLVLAGARGWLDGALQARLKQMTDGGHVRWLGFVPQEDMPALYGACASFLFFPVYEGYGMPVREALLCGAPVLCSNLSALREAGGALASYAGCGVDDIRQALLMQLARPHAPATPGPDVLSALRGGELEQAARFAQVLRKAGGRKPAR